MGKSKMHGELTDPLQTVRVERMVRRQLTLFNRAYGAVYFDSRTTLQI